MEKHQHATSRRRFLKQSSLAVASTALASSMVGRVHAAGDDTLKVALIGCGGRGTGAATQILSTNAPVKLWAMADTFADRIETSHAGLVKGQGSRYDREAHQGYANKIDVPPERRFVGFDAYKQAVDSGVDVVILATSPHFRPIHFEYAVAQGKHVFMEKPVAVDAPGIRQVLAAAQQAKEKNLKVGVGLQRHHHKVYQETIEKVRSGVLGELIYLRANWNGGYLWAVNRTPEMSEMEYQMRNWNYFTWLSGDHDVEQHVHNLDICYWILGKTPAEANGMGGRQVRKGSLYGQIFDHHAVEFTYDDGVKVFSQCRQMQGCTNDVSEHVYGTKGTCDVGRGQITGETKWRCRARAANPYQVEHDVLVDAIRNDKPHMEAEYAAYATMTAIMGRMATYSGKTVTWDEALNSDLRLAPEAYTMAANPPVMPNEQGLYPVAVPGVTKAW